MHRKKYSFEMEPVRVSERNREGGGREAGREGGGRGKGGRDRGRGRDREVEEGRSERGDRQMGIQLETYPVTVINSSCKLISTVTENKQR